MELYRWIAEWCYANPVESDVIVVTAVVGSIVYLLRRQRRTRRRLHRYMWGKLMKKEDREKLQKMRFEDALVDAAMEMVHSGEMTDAQEKHWFNVFAEKYEFLGLIPGKDVKRGIRTRLKKRFGLKPIIIPGGKAIVKIDKTYDPNEPETEGLTSSRYARKK